MKATPLTGQFLIAMPNMNDPRFSHAVVFICTHNETGAMGLIINRLYGAIDMKGLLEQLTIPTTEQTPEYPIYFGGPVETGRGFILHSDDYTLDASMRLENDVALTATIDILRAIAENRGPARCLVSLGYSGWGAGQLEQEIQAGGWLTAPADLDILFDTDNDTKWERAIAKLGFSPWLLSTETGHA
ncbi:MAG: YqgE/AlgH family protein [Alphaproteobacteria bacterium]|nr:YqgE/AlgH family protein [Alphaproteobacteria bacterium]